MLSTSSPPRKSPRGRPKRLSDNEARALQSWAQEDAAGGARPTLSRLVARVESEFGKKVSNALVSRVLREAAASSSSAAPTGNSSAAPRHSASLAAAVSRSRELLEDGRTVAFAAAACGVRRSELERQLAAANVSTVPSDKRPAGYTTAPEVVMFTPDEPLMAREKGVSPVMPTLLGAIASTTSSLDVAFCELTNEQIADAIIAVHARRDVDVRVITNKQVAQKPESCVAKLVAAGVPVRSRNKLFPAFCIIDGERIIRGDGDWTQDAALLWVGSISISDDPLLVRGFSLRFPWGDEDDPPMSEEELVAFHKAMREI